MDTETHIHSSLSHDHVVKLLASAEDSRCIYLIVTWAEGGDLRQHMPGMSERRLRDFIIIPLLQALALLEQQVRTRVSTTVERPPDAWGMVVACCIDLHASPCWVL